MRSGGQKYRRRKFHFQPSGDDIRRERKPLAFEQSQRVTITTTTVPNGQSANHEPQFPLKAPVEVPRDRAPDESGIGDVGGASSIGSGEEEIALSFVESSARKIFDAPSPEIKFGEDPPRRRDPALDEFDREVGEAARLQGLIVETENEIEDGTKDAEGRLVHLEIEQILVCFRIVKLVGEDKALTEEVDRYALATGVRRHGNQKIPYSHLMRAIVAQGATKGTRTARRRQQRATTYAGAVDHALRAGMTDEKFRAEIETPHKKVGEYHGIEHLAKKGRAARRKEQLGEPVPSPEAMPYTASGDFAGKLGDYLMLITVSDGAAPVPGALLDVSESMLRRVRAADAERRKNPNASTPHPCVT
jgi:hypothetical protein